MSPKPHREPGKLRGSLRKRNVGIQANGVQIHQASLDLPVAIRDHQVAGLEISVQHPLGMHPPQQTPKRIGAAIGLTIAHPLRLSGHPP